MQIKYLWALICVVFPLQSLAAVGDTYFCRETEVNRTGLKKEHTLFWGQDWFEIKDDVKQGVIDTSAKRKFTFQSEGYFFSIYQYRNGHVFSAFDGSTYSTRFVRESYTFSTSYDCSKLD